MRIGVILHEEKTFNDYSYYILEILSEYAQSAGYEVKAWSNVVPAASQQFETNAVVVITSPSSKFGVWWWRTFKLPFILKRINPTSILYLNIFTGKYKSKKNFLFLDKKEYLNKSKAATAVQKQTTSNLQASGLNIQEIASCSQHLLDILKNNFNQNTSFTLIPYTAYDYFKPSEVMNEILIKSQFTENKEYFICILSDEDENAFITVSKAFSKFKKWQNSSMQLLLLPKYSAISISIQNKHSTYKYKNDVLILNDLTTEETAALVSASYALLHVPFYEYDVLPAVVALQAATPVITFRYAALEEYCGDAALYASENNFEALGDEMIKLYKNEDLRSRMKENCTKQSESFDRRKVSEKLWKMITVTV